MCFKMPIVCKEVYLPFVNPERLTFVEYKEKYGIDLHDYLKIDGAGNIVPVIDRQDFIKIFVAIDSGSLGYGKVVEPLQFLILNSKQVICANRVDNGEGSIASALIITYVDNKFGVSEL